MYPTVFFSFTVWLQIINMKNGTKKKIFYCLNLHLFWKKKRVPLYQFSFKTFCFHLQFIHLGDGIHTYLFSEYSLDSCLQPYSLALMSCLQLNNIDKCIWLDKPQQRTWYRRLENQRLFSYVYWICYRIVSSTQFSLLMCFPVSTRW